MPYRSLRPAVLATLALIAVVTAACGPAPASPTPLPPSPAPPVSIATTAPPGGRGVPITAVPTAAGYSLRVLQGASVLKAFSTSALEALPQQTYTIGGRGMTGTPIRRVLAAAGVTGATAIQVAGLNNIRNEPFTATFAWAELTDRVLLGVNRRGAGKFFGPDLPGDRWVIDVTTITVAP